MTEISKAQVRAIHVALARRGIDDADYRDILRTGWGVDTCKALDRRQASELLRRLGRPGGRTPAPRRPRPPPGVTEMVTPDQARLIEELKAEVPWAEADGYERWLNGNMGLERAATRLQAQRVIEGLKAMSRRARA